MCRSSAIAPHLSKASTLSKSNLVAHPLKRNTVSVLEGRQSLEQQTPLVPREKVKKNEEKKPNIRFVNVGAEDGNSPDSNPRLFFLNFCGNMPNIFEFMEIRL
ncbi:hypothetical protein CEXT_596041 [Caerostris extrusa]|uniref:Uncharacterized protein n=1 Tax=Caerostris extrusa TaxID=172846 RepID=A0AAV4P335_CAEEX|nr:hypothetical protein CEXT_596041 [Caerostris extrusa]